MEGIDPDQHTFLTPDRFTPKLSAIVYVMRIVLTNNALPEGRPVDGEEFRTYLTRFLLDGSFGVYTEQRSNFNILYATFFFYIISR